MHLCQFFLLHLVNYRTYRTFCLIQKLTAFSSRSNDHLESWNRFCCLSDINRWSLKFVRKSVKKIAAIILEFSGSSHTSLSSPSRFHLKPILLELKKPAENAALVNRSQNKRFLNYSNFVLEKLKSCSPVVKIRRFFNSNPFPRLTQSPIGIRAAEQYWRFLFSAPQ